MSQHSKGPWKHCGARAVDGEMCQCGLVWTIPGDNPIAKVLFRNEEEGTHYGRDLVAANARLIAAAPQLLEALKAELRRSFYGHRQEQCGRCGVTDGHKEDCPIGPICALIRQIEGP